MGGRRARPKDKGTAGRGGRRASGGDGGYRRAGWLDSRLDGRGLHPGATLAKTLALVQDYDSHKAIYKPEVQDSKLVKRTGDEFLVHLRLLKKQVITVVLNTNHDVRHFPLDAARCYSQSHSIRIAEVENPGAPDEREMEPGHDHGFLWRLNSYWRFEERDGGVYVECEAISLTRSVPVGLGWLVNPIVRTLPRESLENSLKILRRSCWRGAELGLTR